MPAKFLLLSCLAACFLAACAGGSDTPQTTKVFKPRGSIQCELGSGTPPEVMRLELTNAGISVISQSCGFVSDVAIPAICGIGTGALNIFEIPEIQAQAAAALSFSPLSSAGSVSESPCP